MLTGNAIVNVGDVPERDVGGDEYERWLGAELDVARESAGLAPNATTRTNKGEFGTPNTDERRTGTEAEVGGSRDGDNGKEDVVIKLQELEEKQEGSDRTGEGTNYISGWGKGRG